MDHAPFPQTKPACCSELTALEGIIIVFENAKYRLRPGFFPSTQLPREDFGRLIIHAYLQPWSTETVAEWRTPFLHPEIQNWFTGGCGVTSLSGDIAMPEKLCNKVVT